MTTSIRSPMPSEAFYESCFVKAVVEVFSEQYLRAPNAEDTARLMAINHARGWPGMLGSIDCMQWKWDKCPTAWRGAYTGQKDGPTMILEAVASSILVFLVLSTMSMCFGVLHFSRV